MPSHDVEKELVAVVVSSTLAVSLSVVVVLCYALWQSAGVYEPSALDAQVEQAVAEHRRSTDPH
ncbi:MAG: hypothetical protein WD534_08110 [Phycisphaeraceae bacterium]